MSQPITVTISHQLGKAEARRRIETGFADTEKQIAAGPVSMLSLTQRWEGDTLHLEGGGLGQKITGQVAVRDDSVTISIDVPPLLAAFAEQIAGQLKQHGQKLLSRK